MKFALVLALVFASTSAFAIKLSDYQPYEYEVLFTNPVCKTYYYDGSLETNSGDFVTSKPKGAYCKSSDTYASRRRSNSPHKRLVDWIRDGETREIFMSFLSFSNGDIKDELCNAIRRRGVEVTLLIDSNNSPDANDGSTSRMRTANALKRCGAQRVDLRGGSGSGSDRVGYAHNKVFIVNPQSKGKMKIAFASANMSTGTTTHHENWHFVTTNAASYFAQAHLCLMNGMLKFTSGKRAYSNFIKSCRRRIKAEEESDIKTFFVPGEGQQATNFIMAQMRKARSIDLAAHRFSYGRLISELGKQLDRNKEVRLVADDDLYWTGVLRRSVGRNTSGEWSRTRGLIRKGMKASYIQTYADDVRDAQSMQLQHNKFLIFNYGSTGAVFTGAGNLTSSAFFTNFENFYGITIPSVVKAFQKQYKYLFDRIGRQGKDMPKRYALP